MLSNSSISQKALNRIQSLRLNEVAVKGYGPPKMQWAVGGDNYLNDFNGFNELDRLNQFSNSLIRRFSAYLINETICVLPTPY